MPLDPNIAMSYKPVQIQDPMDMYAKRQQIQTNALAMQKYETESAEKNALAQLISQPGYDPYKPEAQAAAFKVAPNLAPALFKNLQETRTANVKYDTDKLALGTAQRNEANAKKLDAITRVVQFTTPESAIADLARSVAVGDLTQAQADAILPTIPKTEKDMPAWKQKTMFGLLDIKDQLSTETTTQNLGNISRTTVRPKFAGGAKPDVTDATIGLSADAASAAASAAARLTQDQAQFNVTTGLQRQELGQKGKEISAQEGRTAFLSSRIFNAATEISDLTTKNPDFFKKGMWEAAFGGGALSNFVNPAERQIVSSAIGEITDAALTLGTGAAYTREQIQQKKKFYEPAFTDKPETVQIKKTRFKQLMMDTKKQAGEAWTPEMDAAVAALFPPPPAATPKQTIPRAGTPPKGIDQRTWDHMTPQERKLWPR